jgi:hypothetical protein
MVSLIEHLVTSHIPWVIRSSKTRRGELDELTFRPVLSKIFLSLFMGVREKFTISKAHSSVYIKYSEIIQHRLYLIFHAPSLL